MPTVRKTEAEGGEELVYPVLSEKERRNLAILEIVRKKSPVTRADISKITGINLVSISNYMKNYLSKGIILEEERGVSSGGRKPELVQLNADENFVIGIEAGRREFAAILTDIALNVVKKIRLPRQNADSKKAILELENVVQELIKSSSKAQNKIKVISIGTSDKKLSQAAAGVGKKFGAETFIASEAVCAALGEKTLNPNCDIDSLLYVYSDLGYGVVIKNDSILEDAEYLRPWPEHLGIIEMAKKEVARGVGTSVVPLAKGEINNITGSTVIKAALDKDEVALDIVRSAGMNLGVRIAYLINLFDPKVIVIGGGMEKAADSILEPMRKTVRRFVFNALVEKIRIIPGSLGEDAVSLGAASLAVREIFLKV